MTFSIHLPQLLVLDSRVGGWRDLALGVRPGVTVLPLDPHTDGVRQVLAALEEAGPVAAIHLVGQGEPARLRMGSGWLDAGALEQRAGALARLGAGISPGGALLIWGEDVAADTAGQVFVARLARALGRDVAVSDELMGGGDWGLAVATGPIGLSPGDAVLPGALARFEGESRRMATGHPAGGRRAAAFGSGGYA